MWLFLTPTPGHVHSRKEGNTEREWRSHCKNSKENAMHSRAFLRIYIPAANIIIFI